jgi:hypothetical protein
MPPLATKVCSAAIGRDGPKSEVSLSILPLVLHLHHAAVIVHHAAAGRRCRADCRNGKHHFDGSGFVEPQGCFDRVALFQRVLQIRCVTGIYSGARSIAGHCSSTRARCRIVSLIRGRCLMASAKMSLAFPRLLPA